MAYRSRVRALHQRGHHCGIAVGYCLLNDGRRKQALQGWFDRLRSLCRSAILPFDEPVALRWGQMNARLTRKRRRLPARDSFLAATAVHHDLIIATRNEKDFTQTEVETINPWIAQ